MELKHLSGEEAAAAFLKLQQERVDLLAPYTIGATPSAEKSIVVGDMSKGASKLDKMDLRIELGQNLKIELGQNRLRQVSYASVARTLENAFLNAADPLCPRVSNPLSYRKPIVSLPVLSMFATAFQADGTCLIRRSALVSLTQALRLTAHHPLVLLRRRCGRVHMITKKHCYCANNTSSERNQELCMLRSDYCYRFNCFDEFLADGFAFLRENVLQSKNFHGQKKLKYSVRNQKLVVELVPDTSTRVLRNDEIRVRNLTYFDALARQLLFKNIPAKYELDGGSYIQLFERVMRDAFSVVSHYRRKLYLNTRYPYPREQVECPVVIDSDSDENLIALDPALIFSQCSDSDQLAYMLERSLSAFEPAPIKGGVTLIPRNHLEVTAILSNRDRHAALKLLAPGAALMEHSDPSEPFQTLFVSHKAAGDLYGIPRSAIEQLRQVTNLLKWHPLVVMRRRDGTVVIFHQKFWISESPNCATKTAENSSLQSLPSDYCLDGRRFENLLKTGTKLLQQRLAQFPDATPAEKLSYGEFVISSGRIELELADQLTETSLLEAFDKLAATLMSKRIPPGDEENFFSEEFQHAMQDSLAVIDAERTKLKADPATSTSHRFTCPVVSEAVPDVICWFDESVYERFTSADTCAALEQMIACLSN